MDGFRGVGSRGGVTVGTAQGPLRLMTLRDFYDCFLSYEKSYEAVLCVFFFCRLFVCSSASSSTSFFLSFSGNL